MGLPMRRRRGTERVLAAAAGLVAVGVAVAAATGFGFGGTGPDGDATAGDRPPATAKVARQTLVDTRSESGELGYGDQVSVGGRLTGTVTGLPASGSTVARGRALYRVDNGPVVLLY